VWRLPYFIRDRWPQGRVRESSRTARRLRPSCPRPKLQHMRLAPGQQIAGFPATTIRNLLRHFSEEGGRYPSMIARRLKVSEEQAEQLAAELLRLGLLRPFDSSGRSALSLTPEGARLAQARAGAPFSGATAARRLSELTDRIPEANANEAFAYVVERAVLFGSFLSRTSRRSETSTST
jgi:hypothetical protein